MGRFTKTDREEQQAVGTRPAVEDERFAGTYPAIWDYLTTDRWEDGEVRETSTFTLSVHAGRLQISCSDRDGERVAFVTGDSVEAVWAAMERVLAAGRADWRAWLGPKRKQPPRRSS